MPPEYGARLMRERANKITGAAQKDIHESNRGYLQKSYENALFVARKYNWQIISCVNGENIRTIEQIHDEIYQKIKQLL